MSSCKFIVLVVTLYSLFLCSSANLTSGGAITTTLAANISFSANVTSNYPVNYFNLGFSEQYTSEVKSALLEVGSTANVYAHGEGTSTNYSYTVTTVIAFPNTNAILLAAGSSTSYTDVALVLIAARVTSNFARIQGILEKHVHGQYPGPISAAVVTTELIPEGVFNIERNTSSSTTTISSTSGSSTTTGGSTSTTGGTTTGGPAPPLLLYANLTFNASVSTPYTASTFNSVYASNYSYAVKSLLYGSAAQRISVSAYAPVSPGRIMRADSYKYLLLVNVVFEDTSAILSGAGSTKLTDALDKIKANVISNATNLANLFTEVASGTVIGGFLAPVISASTPIPVPVHTTAANVSVLASVTTSFSPATFDSDYATKYAAGVKQTLFGNLPFAINVATSSVAFGIARSASSYNILILITLQDTYAILAAAGNITTNVTEALNKINANIAANSTALSELFSAVTSGTVTVFGAAQDTTQDINYIPPVITTTATVSVVASVSTSFPSSTFNSDHASKYADSVKGAFIGDLTIAFAIVVTTNAQSSSTADNSYNVLITFSFPDSSSILAAAGNITLNNVSTALSLIANNVAASSAILTNLFVAETSGSVSSYSTPVVNAQVISVTTGFVPAATTTTFTTAAATTSTTTASASTTTSIATSASPVTTTTVGPVTTSTSAESLATSTSSESVSTSTNSVPSITTTVSSDTDSSTSASASSDSSSSASATSAAAAISSSSSASATSSTSASPTPTPPVPTVTPTPAPNLPTSAGTIFSASLSLLSLVIYLIV